MAVNRMTDPAFFSDLLEAFEFSYDWWHVTGQVVDEYGNQKNTFTKLPLKGSLQPKSYSRQMSKEGMVETRPYWFGCLSMYRIDVGDFINYQNQWLIVTGVEPYDEYGVRSCDLETANPAQYRDLTEAVKAQTGETII